MLAVALGFLSLLFFAPKTLGAPYMGTVYNAEQPNGSVVEVRLFGDEFYMRAETLDGYTVIRDKQTGWICYATYDKISDELISTQVPVENQTNTLIDLPWLVGDKHQTLPMDTFVHKVNLNYTRLFPGSTGVATINNIGGVLMAAPPTPLLPSPTGEVSGEILSLTVIVDFSDAPAPLPLSAYEVYFNDLNWAQDGNSMSIRRYYKEVSFGKVDLKNLVHGIYRAKKTFAEYDSMPYGSGATEILKDVLQRLDDEGFDFSQLDRKSVV